MFLPVLFVCGVISVIPHPFTYSAFLSSPFPSFLSPSLPDPSLSYFSFLSALFTTFPSFFFFPFSPEVAPLNPARGLGSAVSSPNGVWGEVLAKIKFGTF